MTKTNSNKIKTKNRVILSVVIMTAVVITGVFLASPIVSFVTAIQSSNMTAKENATFGEQSPKINGSINVLEKAQTAIENDLKTSFIQAANIAAATQYSNDTILLGGHLGLDQGYLVYKFYTINPTNHTAYKTIIDAGNGSVLYKSGGKQMMNFFEKSGDLGKGHGMFGLSGEHGYRQGQGHELFGFGHWKGSWGLNGQSDNNSTGPWH